MDCTPFLVDRVQDFSKKLSQLFSVVAIRPDVEWNLNTRMCLLQRLCECGPDIQFVDASAYGVYLTRFAALRELGVDESRLVDFSLL